jgi:hypothetical protein
VALNRQSRSPGKFFVRGTAGGAYHTQAIGAKRTDDPCVETALTGWAIFDQR